MKLLSALAVTALLGTSAAFAASPTTAPTSGGTATAPAATSAAPATSTASGKPTAHAHHGMSLKACNKKADEKKLTGDERTTFVKDCRAGKEAK